jgi:hypothetical protein
LNQAGGAIRRRLFRLVAVRRAGCTIPCGARVAYFPMNPASPPVSRAVRAGVFGLIALATLELYTRPLLRPMLLQDDFQILAQSWTWTRTLEGIWVPQNEHAMPLGRLLTAALVHLSGRAENVPVVVVWHWNGYLIT